jgi:hypothetical protein
VLPAGASQAHCTHRSCRFSRLQRLDPRVALQACCILQPILRFTEFSRRAPSPRRFLRDQSQSSSRSRWRTGPPRAVMPFEAFPLLVAIRRRAALSHCTSPLTPDLMRPPSIPRASAGLSGAASRPCLPSRRCVSRRLRRRVRLPVKGDGRLRPERGLPTSRLVATSRSVANPTCFHFDFARCSLGLCRLQACRPRCGRPRPSRLRVGVAPMGLRSRVTRFDAQVSTGRWRASGVVAFCVRRRFEAAEAATVSRRGPLRTSCPCGPASRRRPPSGALKTGFVTSKSGERRSLRLSVTAGLPVPPWIYAGPVPGLQSASGAFSTSQTGMMLPTCSARDPPDRHTMRSSLHGAVLTHHLGLGSIHQNGKHDSRLVAGRGRAPSAAPLDAGIHRQPQRKRHAGGAHNRGRMGPSGGVCGGPWVS